MQEPQILSDEISHAFLQRAKIYFKLRLYKDALTDFAKANSLLTDNHADFSYVALIKCIFDNHRATIAAFNSAIQLNPMQSSLHYYLAMAYLEMQDFAKAYSHAMFALQLESDNVDYQKLLIEITCKQNVVKNKHFFAKSSFAGSNTSYTELVVMLIEANKNIARAYLNHAQNSYTLGDYQSSLGYLDAALCEYPDNAFIHNNRGLIYIKLNEYFRAINDLTTAIILKPARSNFYFNRALAYEKLERFDEAIGDCQAALTLEPNNAEYNEFLLFLSKSHCDSTRPFIGSLLLEHNPSTFFHNGKQVPPIPQATFQPDTKSLLDFKDKQSIDELPEKIVNISQ